MFCRPWVIMGAEREYYDMVDGKKFSTEFSHTRFLVPEIMQFNGWALFMDCDMICMSDISKLFALCDDKYAVMCVKHNHIPMGETSKMDGREQMRYHRKNWSSFMLWNCSHPANRIVTKGYVNSAMGGDMHAFSWLPDSLIGSLPDTYNYIAGVSPKRGGMPDVIHFTNGGPWFDTCQDVPFAGNWLLEYEDWQRNGPYISDIPSTAYEREDIRK